MKLTARIHNVYDEFINYDAQEAVITVLVNDIPYAAFDGSKYLGISVDKITTIPMIFRLILMN